MTSRAFAARARAVLIGTIALVSTAHAQSVDQLRLIAPAAPGGGWDQTARVMQQALQRAGIVRTGAGREHSGRGRDDRPRAIHRRRARHTATC